MYLFLGLVLQTGKVSLEVKVKVMKHADQFVLLGGEFEQRYNSVHISQTILRNSKQNVIVNSQNVYP